MRKREKKLVMLDLQDTSWSDMLKFTFERKSFFRDYKLLHAKSEEDVKERLKYVLSFMNLKSLSEEVRLCFNAAVQMESRQTYHFNLFVIDLIECYYADAIYYSNKKEMREDYLITHDDPSPISFEWVLYSRILNPYQRYLLFEYLVLGYSIDALAERRYCTRRTISSHLQTIVDVLDSQGHDLLVA